MKKNLLVIAFVALAFPACSTLNPLTGVLEYDPVKTEQVKAAIEPFVTAALGSAIAKNGVKHPELAEYYRSVGRVFCKMEATSTFSVDFLVEEINKLATPALAKSDPLVLLAKDAAIALYRINYAARHRAELPADKWPAHVAGLLCNGIDTALLNAGLPGVK